MRVFVYFNLTRKCWSVRAAEGPEKGRVIAHCSHVGLQDCKFLVSERQRQKVVATGKETVHAGIRGIMVKLVGTPTEAGQRLGYEPTIQTTPNNCVGWVPVAYNPFKYRKFVRRTDGAEIDYADAVVLGQGAWAHLEDTLGYAVERTTKKETKA